MKHCKEISQWTKPIFSVAVLLLLIYSSIGFVTIRGESMNPTLKDREYFLINKLAYVKNEPDRFDIVVFESNLTSASGEKKKLIKRIIGLPNDEIEILDGEIYINDNSIDEKYVFDDLDDENIDFLVPYGKFFVMGDNRKASLDSRNPRVGYVDKKNIYGKLWIKVF